MAVKAIFAGAFVNRLGAFLSIFLVLFVASKGHSAAAAAATLGAYGVGGVIGTLIGGVLADRLGARTATVFSMASSAVLTVSLLYLPNYALLFAVTAVLGLVSLVFRPASATLLSELTPESRQVMVFAMYRFAVNVGTTASPLLGYALYAAGGHRYTLLFWGEGLVAVVYGILALYALPRKERAPRTDAAGDAEPADSLLDVLRNRRYVMFLIAVFFNTVVYMQYLSTLPLDIKAQGVALIWYTVAVALNGAIVIAFELPLTKISQHWPVKVSICSACVLVGLGMASYGLPLGPAVVVLGTLIWTTGEIVGAPAMFAYPAIAGPAQLKGRYIGTFQFMFAAGSALGPVIGGLLFTALDHRVWPVVSVGSFIAALLVVIAVRQPAAEAEQELAEAELAEVPTPLVPPAVESPPALEIPPGTAAGEVTGAERR
ncbi:MFS transporter [Jatrophihabitans sp.]|uniref:MFS transporter n=1 Tax=Jatrophihabitans sp. TaxID=1932789 RepID=UPI002B7DBF6D|nr:MFS transporter [Jatrophihabitans sp.]